VLALVASGLGDAEIADRLGYSRNYVKKILVSVRNRLGARDRAHAAALAATFGYVRATGTGRFAPGMATAMDAFAPLPHLYDVRDVLVDARPGREVHHAAAGGEA
jgi:hypothetical protein